MNRKLKSFMLFVILGVSSLIVSSCDWFGGGKTSSSTTSSETSSESSSEVISSDSTSSDSTSSVDSSSVVIEVFTVTFDTDGGDLVDPQEVNKGEKATEPTTPTKDGYYFVEWQLNGQKFDFNTPITEDITLKAIWDNYKITIFLDKVTLRNYTMTLSGTQRMVMGDVDLIFDYHQLMKVDAVDEVIYLYQESSNPLFSTTSRMYSIVTDENLYLLNYIFSIDEDTWEIEKLSFFEDDISDGFYYLFDELEYVQRGNTPIFDVLLTEEQKESLIDFPIEADVLMYVNVETLTVYVEMSFSDETTTYEINYEIKFSEFGTTDVGLSDELLKNIINLKYQEDIEYAKTIYITESNLDEFTNMINGYKTQIESLTDYIDILETYLTSVDSMNEFEFEYDELASRKGNAIGSINYYYDLYSQILADDVESALNDIYINAISSIQNATDYATIYQTHDDFYVEFDAILDLDETKTLLQDKKEQIRDLLYTYTEVVLMLDANALLEMKSIIEEFNNEIDTIKSLSELNNYLYDNIFIRLESLPLNINSSKLEIIKNLVITNLELEFGYFDYKDEVIDDYIFTIESIKDKTNLLYIIIEMQNFQLTLEFTGYSHYSMDLINERYSYYLDTASNESLIEIERIKDDVLLQISESRSLTYIRFLVDKALREMEINYEYDPIKAHKSNVIYQINNIYNELKDLATDESILAMTVVRDEYLQSVNNATNHDEIEQLYFEFDDEIYAAYVEDPSKVALVYAKNEAIVRLYNRLYDLYDIALNPNEIYSLGIYDLVYDYIDLIADSNSLVEVNNLVEIAFNLINDTNIEIDFDVVDSKKDYYLRNLEELLSYYDEENEYFDIISIYNSYIERINNTIYPSVMSSAFYEAYEHFALIESKISSIDRIYHFYQDYVISASKESAIELEQIFNAYKQLILDEDDYNNLYNLVSDCEMEFNEAYVYDELQYNKNRASSLMKEYYERLVLTASDTNLDELETILNNYLDQLKSITDYYSVNDALDAFYVEIYDSYIEDLDKSLFYQTKVAYINELDDYYLLYSIYCFDYDVSDYVMELIKDNIKLLNAATSIQELNQIYNNVIDELNNYESHIDIGYSRMGFINELNYEYDQIFEIYQHFAVNYNDYIDIITNSGSPHLVYILYQKGLDELYLIYQKQYNLLTLATYLDYYSDLPNDVLEQLETIRDLGINNIINDMEVLNIEPIYLSTLSKMAQIIDSYYS